MKTQIRKKKKSYPASDTDISEIYPGIYAGKCPHCKNYFRGIEKEELSRIEPERHQGKDFSVLQLMLFTAIVLVILIIFKSL